MKRKYKKTVFYVKNICYDDLENKKEKGTLQKFKFAKSTEMILKFNRNDLKWQREFYAFVLQFMSTVECEQDTQWKILKS